MNSAILTDILKDYERKRNHAEKDLDERKQKLYEENPRLQEIDNELSKLGISTAKNLIMKKRFFKLMPVAVALAALTSCSDDLGIGNSNARFSGDADLVATLNTDGDVATRLGMKEVEGHNPWDEKAAANWNWVFTEGDKVRVFTMKSMEYQSYELIAGENTEEGQFRVEANAPELPEGMDKYAITDAQFAYGVSPMPDGTPRLTYTIPYKYKAITYATDEEGVNVQKLPAPFWGKAVTEDGVGDQGKILRSELNGLTAFLRINTEVLPEGTNYIVLTTHGSKTEMEDGTIESDGFQLLKPDPDDDSKVKVVSPTDGSLESKTFTDNIAFWDENATKIEDGNSEPLSGTFNALLVDKSSHLEKDKGLNEEGEEGGETISRLVTRDEIVIDITAYDNNGVFWIPIIPETYYNLHVLAVTKMSKYAYKYIGTEIQHYNRKKFEAPKRYHLDLNLTNLGKVCAHDLNMAIENINHANKYNLTAQNIINVDTLTNCTHSYLNGDDHDHGNKTLGSNPLTVYPNDQILVQGQGDLVINIATIDATAGAKGNMESPVLNNVGVLTNTLFVSDKNYANGTVYKYTDYASAAITTENSVKINMPSAWAADETYALLADLPKTNAIFAANTNYADAAQRAATNLRVDVHGSATEFVSGREAIATTDGYELKDITDAAIKVVSGLGQLNVLEETKGDVYITGNETEEKVELTKGLFVYTKAGIDVRMDNALAKQFGFPQTVQPLKNYLITTGSSATQAVGVADDLGSGAIKRGTDQEGNYPNTLDVLAFWTGNALDMDAEGIKDYDVTTVYTTAQLASMGEEIYTTGTPDDKSTTATYKMSDLLAYVWLGGANGWVGPKVTVAEFSFDGNGKGLKNMHMPLNVKDGIADQTGQIIYTYDPHFCCTTCGWNRNISYLTDKGSAVEPMESFGLIRSIDNTVSATIKNVQLNDVYADQAVNDIGSLVGVVTKTGNLTLDNNFVGEVRLECSSNVGGLIGNIQEAEKVSINKNTVGSSSYSTGYVRGDSNVGGMIGNFETNNPLSITNSKVILAKDISAAGDNAGGVAGNVKAGKTDLTTVSVEADTISAGGENAAGFIAKFEAEAGNNAITVTDAKVSVAKNIESERYAAGLLANLSAPETNVWGAEIKSGTIKAEEGFVGGQIAVAGYPTANNVNFGYKTGNNNEPYNGKQLVNKVEVDLLAGAFYVGGVIGDESTNTKVYIYGDQDVSQKRSMNNEVNIKAFANTKSNLEALYNPAGATAQFDKAGTMSNVAGVLNGNLYINETYLTVVDNLDGAMKVAVGYKYHNDQGATPNQNIRKFWGDANGYVGYGKSGNYFRGTGNNTLEEDTNKVGNDFTEDTYAFNVYLSDDDYSRKSKNAPAE